MNNLIAVRGGGDIGTACAHRLFKAGFKVYITEVQKPTVIRRSVSFAQALYSGITTVEGVRAVWVEDILLIEDILKLNAIPVIIDPCLASLEQIRPSILVDCTLSKENIGIKRGMASLVIGLGPGFAAGDDVDMVIETQRGHNLGRIITKGRAEEDTKIPYEVMGYTAERLVRSPRRGIVNRGLAIGSRIKEGDIVCYVDNMEVKAEISGVLRGIIANGLWVRDQMKIGDIDPRGIEEYCYTISDKGRTISGSVLEAACSFFKG